MVKITEALAKKMYDNGEEIMICPSKVRPDGMLSTGWHTHSKNPDHGEFEKLCRAVWYYNCSPENGNSLVFYAKEV